MVWIPQQDVQKPTVKLFVEDVAVEMCVDLEGERPREMLRRGNCRSLLKQLSNTSAGKKSSSRGRRDGPSAGPGSLSRGDGEIAASTPTTITVVVTSQHVSTSRARNPATRLTLGRGPEMNPALGVPSA